MGRLGRIKNVVDNMMDARRIKIWRRNEINKFQDSRRVAIWSKIHLTREQEQQIDDFYLANYGEKIPHTWHKHFTAFTGHFDYKYFPELLYIPEFEHFMNSDAKYYEVFQDKNVLPLIAASVGVHTPQVIITRTKGIFRDEHYRFISEDRAADILSCSGEVFIKPSIDTGSGVGCKVIGSVSRDEAHEVFTDAGANFVVQERLKCHEDVAKIYAGSVNTFRVITYLWHDEIKICPAIMRIGQGGSTVDNAHAGGMFIAVDDDGTLHKTAFTEFNTQFTEHPNTHLKFEGHRIKVFPKVLEAVRKIHEATLQVGAVNWDFTLDEDGRPILLEGNMKGGSIWLIEMAHGVGVFGDDTAEILKWTRKMKQIPFSERHKYTGGRS